jgi:hypothetical protein
MNKIPSIELYDLQEGKFLDKKDFFIWGRDLCLFIGYNHTSKESGFLYKKLKKTIEHYLCTIENNGVFLPTYPFQDRVFDNRYVMLDDKLHYSRLNKFLFASKK